jgi:hypothetical protein
MQASANIITKNLNCWYFLSPTLSPIQWTQVPMVPISKAFKHFTVETFPWLRRPDRLGEYRCRTTDWFRTADRLGAGRTASDWGRTTDWVRASSVSDRATTGRVRTASHRERTTLSVKRGRGGGSTEGGRGAVLTFVRPICEKQSNWALAKTNDSGSHTCFCLLWILFSKESNLKTA